MDYFLTHPQTACTDFVSPSFLLIPAHQQHVQRKHAVHSKTEPCNARRTRHSIGLRVDRFLFRAFMSLLSCPEYRTLSRTAGKDKYVKSFRLCLQQCRRPYLPPPHRPSFTRPVSVQHRPSCAPTAAHTPNALNIILTSNSCSRPSTLPLISFPELVPPRISSPPK
jgi:hypothetical protein